jgi:hypothetical protein
MLGKRALCCVAQPYDHSSIKIEDFWNSPEVRQARLDMLSGSPPSKTCQVCITNKNDSYSPTEMFDSYAYLEEQIILETDENGFYNRPPRFFDFRMENLCNLSCRMCDPHASSKIEGLWKKVLSANEPRLKSLVLKNNTLVNEIGPEFEKAIDSGHIDKIYWASGEAFFQKSHWDYIERLQEQGLAENVILKYNTNLNYPLKILQTNFDRLEGFKKVILAVSIDGVEAAGEFIRDGLKWNVFHRALEYALELPFVTIERFKVTVTIPGLLEIGSLLSFLSKQNVEVNLSLCDLGDQSSLLSPLSLDRSLLNELIVHSESELEMYRGSSLFNNFSLILENLKTTELSEYRNVDQLMHSLFESGLIDRAAKRGGLIDYYLSKPFSKKWLLKLVDSYFKSSGPSLSDDSFWQEVHRGSKSTKDVYLTHNSDAFIDYLSFFVRFLSDLDKEHLVVSYIGSFPSVLSKSFIGENLTSKYDPYYFIMNNSKVEMIEFSKIGFFSFLTRSFKKGRPLFRILDSLILAFLPGLFVHYRTSFKLRG